MESGKIKNSQLTASSKWSNYWNAVHARLNSGRFWGAGGAYGQWLKIAFERETAVTKVATQGSVVKNYWVRNYKLSSSKDALTWNFIMKNGAKKVCWVTHWLNMDENLNLIKSSRVDSSWKRWPVRLGIVEACGRSFRQDSMLENPFQILLSHAQRTFLVVGFPGNHGSKYNRVARPRSQAPSYSLPALPRGRLEGPSSHGGGGVRMRRIKSVARKSFKED